MMADVSSGLQFCTPRNDAVASLKLTELRTGGSAGFQDWAAGGSLTPTDFLAVGNAAVTPSAFKKQMTISKYDAEDNPNVFAEIADRISMEAMYKFNSLAWAAIAAAYNTSHPNIGGKKIIDSFSSPVSQTNKGTTALSLSSLQAARANRRLFKNHDDDLIPFQNFKLVVPPALETVGKQLVYSPVYPNVATNGGESDLSNTFAANDSDSGIIGCVTAPLLSDVTDWFLIATDEALKPFWMWLRSPIEFSITPDPQVQNFWINCTFRALVVPKPAVECGIFGAIVAG